MSTCGLTSIELGLKKGLLVLKTFEIKPINVQRELDVIRSYIRDMNELPMFLVAKLASPLHNFEAGPGPLRSH